MSLDDRTQTIRITALSESPASRAVATVEPPRWLGRELQRILQGLLATPASAAGLVLLVGFVLVAVFAPAIAPPGPGGDPYKIPRDGFSQDPRPVFSEWTRNAPPLPFWWKPIMKSDRWIHLMGTTSGQWDIFYGVVWGTRTALWTGLIVTLASLIIGLLLGATAAYYGGAVDSIIMRVVDVFLTLPFLMAALITSAVLTPRIGRSLLPVMLALIAFGWMTYARLIRGEILTVKEREYVLASRIVGARDREILFRHILPNAIFPTLVVASMDLGTVVLSFAGLSFLGVGAEIGYADWGQLLSFSRDWITSLTSYWHIVVFPGVTLILFVLAWNLIGDTLRDVLDPRVRGP